MFVGSFLHMEEPRGVHRPCNTFTCGQNLKKGINRQEREIIERTIHGFSESFKQRVPKMCFKCFLGGFSELD